MRADCVHTAKLFRRSSLRGSLDADWQIELITSEPELVTPTGCCFDSSGRLLVIECHTHFPPDEYDGPKEDRIYRFDDHDGDGVLDRQRLFFEGGSATMGLARLDDGWIAVASRSRVVRIRDGDDDGVADQHEVLIELKTSETYPHNGLAGLAVSDDGFLYVGQGENLGKPYELIAADGSKQIGGGEGGNIFRCRFDGSELERIATGFWNPFGMQYRSCGSAVDRRQRSRRDATVPLASSDRRGRLWVSVPVRAGRHASAAKLERRVSGHAADGCGDGGGTVHVIAPTGGNCGLPVGATIASNATSWPPRERPGQVIPRSSFRETRTFDPAGMAVAPDGSIYVTDWVDRSYPVHGKGRLWRLSRKPEAPPITDQFPRTVQT